MWRYLLLVGVVMLVIVVFGAAVAPFCGGFSSKRRFGLLGLALTAGRR